MQIETKFNVNDKLWFIEGTGQILEIVIIRIDIRVNVGNPSNNFVNKTIVGYTIRPTSNLSYTFNDIKENKLYKTKQEAGEAWMESQGLKCGVSIAD